MSSDSEISLGSKSEDHEGSDSTFRDIDDSEYGEEEELDDSDVANGRRDSKPPAEHETRSDDDLRTKIWNTLQKIETPYAFAFSAVSSSLPNPGLYFPHHGLVSLPLTTHDAQKIISLASPSPFGRGEETVVDNSVRRCWELNPQQFSIKNPAWKNAMEEILKAVGTGLSFRSRGKISADLNKLLLYEPGAFFKAHRDSEKSSGMFGTLVVCLPSPHEGGKLVLTHGNVKYEFETSKYSTFDTSYAAWCADIEHQIQTVTAGYRLILVYNLILKTNYSLPSYHVALELAQRLSTLLQQYDSQLKEENSKLPPIIVHKLKHKYTQASLKFNLLKPQDVPQVQTLIQVATSLGFDIYIATLEFMVSELSNKSRHLNNMVELDGNLLVERMKCPDGALIDPWPQDGRKEDKKYEANWTGNSGCEATYWYYDTVVALVPPSKQLDFVFQFRSEGDVTEALFTRLVQKFLEDPAQKLKLEQLCEQAVKHKPEYWDDYETVPPFFQQATAIVLELRRFKLFDIACERSKYKVMFTGEIPNILGHLIAKKELAKIDDQLMKGLHNAPSLAEAVKFLELVAKGFNAALQDQDPAVRTNFEQWSDKALFSAISQLNAITKADGLSLGLLHKSMDWSLFQTKMMPVILKAALVVKITFVNELMSFLQKSLSDEQRSFIESIIHNIWNDFNLDAVAGVERKHSMFSWIEIKNALEESELKKFMENTISIMCPGYIETTVIPAMLREIPNASKECSEQSFINLVRMILKNELAGFRLPISVTAPPVSHKCLVQALLKKFLMDHVGCEPQPPTNWALPAGECHCSDCTVVNEFLQDPVKKRLDFPVDKQRRRHLYKKFIHPWPDYSKGIVHDEDYDVQTIRTGNPYIWQITKHQGRHEKRKAEWSKRAEIAKKTLLALEKDAPVKGKLETYLEPFYNSIMMADVSALPNLTSLVTLPSSLEASQLALPLDNNMINQPGLKRGASQIELQEDESAKLFKVEMNSIVN
ncbi:unnamed protein product [Bemisia tabaci]|uniref:Prolyl 4-hydroxylase alpha subunit Fe(2+) 2OG dioxygenase domain-containing protein n=1 Tax=Bemisia tabaci TaxID=7038 RepID=A0A9P0AGV6_BEMTA|nr:unnamed protein product [Bemisia tabaci]